MQLLAAVSWQPLIERCADVRVPEPVAVPALLEQAQFQSAIQRVQQRSVRDGGLQQTSTGPQVAERDRREVGSRDQLQNAPGRAIDMRQPGFLEATQRQPAVAILVWPWRGSRQAVLAAAGQ